MANTKEQCPTCLGTLIITSRQTPERVRAVHAATCPGNRTKKKETT